MEPGNHRHLPATGLLASLFVLAVAGSLVADEKRPAQPMLYTGSESCAAPACHGGVQGLKKGVRRNEYSTWLLRDKHAQAYAVLLAELGQRIGKRLRLETKPEMARKCLLCHGLSVPEERRAKSFDKKKQEGVSCESCHGPASGWLGTHIEGEGSHERSRERGMEDTRDLIARTVKCLGCHLGDSEKSVDHEMIAAGHPDLDFELESFSAVMPIHWNEPPEYDKDPWLGVRTMGTGQAVQLREALRRLARRSQGSVWPEYAELQCFACHHSLTAAKDSLTAAKDSWRQNRGYAGRRPGNVPWDESRYAVFRQLAHELDASSGRQLDAELGQLSALVSQLQGDRGKISRVATSASVIADRLAHTIAAAKFNKKQTLKLMLSISGNADGISSQDERAAEQAAMALDSLFVAYTSNTGLEKQAQVKAAIEALFPQFNDPSSYNAFKFARQLRGINALLSRSTHG